MRRSISWRASTACDSCSLGSARLAMARATSAYTSAAWVGGGCPIGGGNRGGGACGGGQGGRKASRHRPTAWQQVAGLGLCQPPGSSLSQLPASPAPPT
jgi:hypothetical protein